VGPQIDPAAKIVQRLERPAPFPLGDYVLDGRAADILHRREPVTDA